MTPNTLLQTTLSFLFALAACSSSSNNPIISNDAALPDGAPVDSADPNVDLNNVDDTDGLAPQCLWPSANRYTLNHFDFSVTLPDGKQVTRGSLRLSADGGALGMTAQGSVIGLVHDVQGHIFTIDTCQPVDVCQPTLYTFVLCSQYSCALEDQSAVHAFQANLAVGRRVQVDYSINAAVGFSVGSSWITVVDADAGRSQGRLYFAGAGGMLVRDNALFSEKTLPFLATLQAQHCGHADTTPDAMASMLGDDFTMVLTSRTDPAKSISIATGQTKVWETVDISAFTNRIFVTCLDAVQPNSTDDYWNWDFWAQREPVAEGN